MRERRRGSRAALAPSTPTQVRNPAVNAVSSRVRDITLAIETSNPSGVAPHAAIRPGVALLRADDVLHVEPIVTHNPQHDDLMGAIERACTAARITPRDLARVAVSVGPGGFTNVRIAVTCARMIAEATGAALIAVPTALVVARSTLHQGPAAIALASKGDTAHVTIITAHALTGDEPLREGQIMDAAALASIHIATLIADSFLPAAMRDVAQKQGWTLLAPIFDPVACARAAMRLPPTDPAQLSPIYPREPEAVTKWRAMHTPGATQPHK
jgi:tRNA threonylcarbamoyladenosine biosynthesis protein TsaB